MPVGVEEQLERSIGMGVLGMRTTSPSPGGRAETWVRVKEKERR